MDGVEVSVDRNTVTLKRYQKEPWKFKVSDGGLANTWKQKVLDAVKKLTAPEVDPGTTTVSLLEKQPTMTTPKIAAPEP